MRITVFLIIAFAGPLGAFPVPKGAQKTEPLGGTVWNGSDNFDSFRITFHENGTLAYKGTTEASGEWKQDGGKITWHINNYSFFEAELDGKTMTGSGHNNYNWKSDFKMTRTSE